MPKRSYTTKRSSYVPRRRSTAASARKPYGGSRYGNDAFIKVEKIEPLGTGALGTINVFSTMRTIANPGGATPGNTYLGD